MKIAKWLQEDRLPTKFSVVLSPSINYEINEVEYFNWNNFEGLQKWHDFIQQVLEYIANPSIAWDYAQRYRHLSNGECFINENGYEVGFCIETNEDTTQTYVAVFRLGLNTEEYGLHIPTNESKKYNKRNKQYNKMNHTRKRIRLTESQLHRVIKKVLKEQYENEDPETEYVVLLDGLKIGKGSILYDIEHEDAFNNSVYDIEEAKEWYDNTVYMALDYEEEYKEHLFNDSKESIAYLVTLVKMTKDEDGWWDNEPLHSTVVFRNKKDKQDAMRYGLYNGKTLCGKNVAKEYIDNPFDDGLDESIRRAIRRIRR